MTETGEESQPKVLTKENETSVAKENQAATLEKQTIVTYTDDELVSFKDNMVSENTKKKYKYIRTPFAVLAQGKTWQTN